MTLLSTRPPRRAPVRRPAHPSQRPQQRRLFAVGAATAVWAATLGLTVAVTVAVLAWAADARSGASLGAVLRLTGAGWLAAQHVGLAVSGGHVGLTPLGLTAVLGALLVRAGRVLARAVGVSDLRAALRAVPALALPYGLLATGLAELTRGPGLAPSRWQAFLAAGLLAAVAGGVGVLRESGLWRLPTGDRSDAFKPTLLAGLSATGVLLAGGLAVVVGSMAWHAGLAARVAGSLRPGLVGSVLLALAALALLPNATVCAAAFATGPGFAVGNATSVAPTGVHLGAVPAFPLLAALPGAGPAPPVALIACALPVAAGGLAGVVLRRHGVVGSLEGAVAAFAAGLLCGGVMAILAALSGGPAGGPMLAAVGPSPWAVGLASAVEVGLVAVITVTTAAVFRPLAGRS